MRALVRLALAGVAILTVTIAGLYQFFGLRVVLNGAGSPRPAFVRSSVEQASLIERDRALHRTATAPQIGSGPTDASKQSPALPDAHQAEPRAAEGVEGGHSVPLTDVVPAPSAESTSVSMAGLADAEWGEFRGRLRDGHYRGTPIITSWPAGGLKALWHQPVGGGYASFSIAGRRAFTIEQRGSQEVVAAYEVDTGRELWKTGWSAEFREFMGGDGPRATPTWWQGRVYALGAMGELRCLDDATGRTVWRRNILEDAGVSNLQWAVAASPLVVGTTVIVLPGGPNGQSVVAYDTITGTRAWSAQSDKQAYASPMLVTLAGRPQLLVVSASRLMGLTPDRGQLLWEFPWVTDNDINAAQPVIIGDGRVFVSSGYGHGAALLEITEAGGQFAAREVWQTNRMKNKFSSSVYHDGYIYGLDEAVMACLDAATGELKWKAGRYGYGQVILAQGHLVVLTEDGDLVLLKASPNSLEEIVRVPVLDGKTWNHPALADGLLLVRNLKEMAAFDLRAR